MAKHQDLTGMTFGRLKVLKEVGKQKPGVYLWECECSCDEHNIVIVNSGALKSGNTKSCGCIHRELLSQRNYDNRKWNIKNDRIYRIWRAMNHRCYNTNDTSYYRYGGKGVIVCKEWHKDFQLFQDWALSHGYTDDLTIDRIDYNGNYCPKNCRWVGYEEQANNTSTNKLLTYKGETHTLAEWCKKLKIDYFRTKARLNVCHWSVEQAFELPKYPSKGEKNEE